MPWWEKSQQGASTAQGAPAAPKVDTAQIDEAKTKAKEAGPQIKAALDVTATPKVDTSSITAATAAADALLSKLNQVGAAAKSAASQVNNAAASVHSGLGALHDGTEVH
jgi:hypothetical protein